MSAAGSKLLKPMPYVGAEPEVTICCKGCGSPWRVSQTYARRVSNGQFAGICRNCRYPTRIHVTQAHRNYWTDRYSMDEIRELAAGLHTLLNDHSKPARGRVGREWDEAA